MKTGHLLFMLFGIILQLHFSFTSAFLASARDFVCLDTTGGVTRLQVTDAWSVKDTLLYLRVNHYLTNSSNPNPKAEVDQRLVVFDAPADRFLHVFVPHDRHTLAQAAESSKLADVVAVSLMSSIDEGKLLSVLYFESRSTLRSNCIQHWFYDPPNSAFCRKHSVTTSLGKTLALVKQVHLNEQASKNNVDSYLDGIYRASHLVSDNFGGSSMKAVNRWSVGPIQDAISSMITASTLVLQLSHPNSGLLARNADAVRFLFSNKLGLFISWMPPPSDFDASLVKPLFSALSPQTNCVVMLPVKLTPTIKLCSKKYTFISVVDLEPNIFLVLPENQVIRLSHEYLIKQFRIFNTLEIDLDSSSLPEHQPKDLFETFFQCSSKSIKKLQQPNVGKDKQQLRQKTFSVNLTDLAIEDELTEEVFSDTDLHRLNEQKDKSVKSK